MVKTLLFVRLCVQWSVLFLGGEEWEMGTSVVALIVDFVDFEHFV